MLVRQYQGYRSQQPLLDGQFLEGSDQRPHPHARHVIQHDQSPTHMETQQACLQLCSELLSKGLSSQH